MQLSHKLDQTLHMLRQEVRTMSQDKEREEHVWRDRLHRCQRQLKVKDEEMSRQAQYFESFKIKLQQKLNLARDREQSLQNRIYSLEKQLLDVTVSCATGMATITAVRITAGTVKPMNELDKLPSMRGEGEGEEENKEERKKQWQPNVGPLSKERTKVDESKTDSVIEGGQDKETKHTSKEARLQSFIISLQEDLKVLLEREEEGMTERRKLLEELQEAQENRHFLGCTVEEMKAELHQLRQSENSMMEEVEDLRKENQSLQEILRDAGHSTPPLSSLKSEATCTIPVVNLPCCCPDTPVSPLSPGMALGQSSTGSLVGEAQSHAVPVSHLSAVQRIDHQGAAEHTRNNPNDHFPPSTRTTKLNPPNDFPQIRSKPTPGFQSLFFSTEFITEPKLGNVEEVPSAESDALSAALHSLGFGDNSKALKEERDHLEDELEHIKAELQAITQENAEIKLQLRRETEKQPSAKAQLSSEEMIITPATCDVDHPLPLNSAGDDAVLDLAQSELILALNQENRALAERIQELQAHIELREEEMKTEQTHLRECICRLEEDVVRLEQENQEQVSLISELTRKTEDDLNTIMELRQKFEESKEKPQSNQHCRSLGQNEHHTEIPGCLQLEKQKECVDSLVENMLKEDKETQLSFSQETVSLTTASLSGCQQNIQRDSLQNHSQNSLHVSSLTDEVAQLNNSIQSLKTEQKELTANISSLREEQKEVALSLQRQTEEKQQLTRSVWALKEQKDCIFQSLHGLKQEKEQLSRVVCSLKDEKDQYTRSNSGLKKEKEELNLLLSALQRDKDVIKESILSGEEERDRIMKSLQSLQTESEQLSQTVLHLNEQRDKITESLKSLTEQRDQKELTHTLKEERDQLITSVSSLKEEKEKVEQSVICLKEEQRNIKQIILSLQEDRCNLQMQAEKTNHELNLRNDYMTKRTEKGDDARGCETSNNRGKSVKNVSDLMREIEALEDELKKSREEAGKNHAEIRKLHTELSQSEARCETLEKKSADQIMRLTESASQREDIMKENETLTLQVKELQDKLMVLLREKTDALSLKAQTDERHHILSAQLKAKTVALEELNSEYVALKRGRGRKDDQTAALVSLRARYNDIRAKYDALLKRKSQTDLDVAPLKAKLSCLVVKCQERNILLAEMMKSMHRDGSLEPRLTQQAEHLLGDAALQDYAAAFSPESKIQRREHYSDFTQHFFSAFQGCNKGILPDPTCPVVSNCLITHQNKVSAESGVQCGESEKHSLIFAREASANFRKVAPAAAETLKETPPGSVSPSSTTVSPVVPLKEIFSTNSPQLSPVTASLEATSRPEKIDFLDLEVKDKHSSDTAEVGIHLHGPPSASSSTRVSPSRRLSSPEKILNLQEELQKTLMDSFQAPENRGRGKHPQRNLSPSAPADLNSPKPARHFPISDKCTESLPVSQFCFHTKHTQDVATNYDASKKSPTLFNAVTSRSTNAKLSPSMFTSCHLKADRSKRQELLICPDFFLKPATHRKDSSISSDDIKLFTHTKQIEKKFNPMLDLSIITQTDPLNTSCSQSACFSPEKSHKAAPHSTAALENASRPRPEAPAEVRSVEVIKTVGQSSLLIGWERPPLDELGCSNDTFVYGYRVFVNKEFHKSVLSSACTKCILENINLSEPVHIGVQTLASNGLHSDSVYTLYFSSNKE
ncbi:protein MLP1 homolog [Xiphophorus couchianus]|uniref:protein MLP1 homolog n=1 Tax=Xiphophorus couchianus TaxID=32473 RepID=UPI001016505F|nr:protein MLP1 homolog [Xiphophorus couchianus]XP_027864770.1 protein MLP1 homolog [Xiphophorus couchianus]